MPFFASLAAVVAAAAVTVPLPPTGGVADYQLGGAYEPAASVKIVTRDRTDPADPARYSICYVNAFQTQPGSLSWWKKHHPKVLLRDSRGRLVSDPGWPDEVLFDIRTKAKRVELARVIDGWFTGCARKGYEAVEPDNLDSWTRSRTLLTKNQAAGFGGALVTRAHAKGLAIAQKNTADLASKRLGFDFAVAEECEVYRECGEYTKVYGTRLIEIEYTDNGRTAFSRACKARAGRASISLRDRDVVPRGAKGYVFRHC